MPEKQLLPDEPEEKRIQYLTNSAAKIEENFSYTHHFTEEEISEKKDALSETAIDIDNVNADFADVKEKYKKLLKPKNKVMSELISALKFKSEQVTGTVYMIDYQDEGVMGYYNEKGELVSQRKLLQGERQLNLLRAIGEN